MRKFGVVTDISSSEMEKLYGAVRLQGEVEIKEPCPCKCGPGYFEPPGRVIKRAIREGR